MNITSLINDYLNGKIEHKDVKHLCDQITDFSEHNSHIILDSLRRIPDVDKNDNLIIRKSDLLQYLQILNGTFPTTIIDRYDWVIGVQNFTHEIISKTSVTTLRHWSDGLGFLEEGRFFLESGSEYVFSTDAYVGKNLSIANNKEQSKLDAFIELSEFFKFSSAELTEVHDEVDLTKVKTYNLKRMDDNGVEYLINSYFLYGEALKQKEIFESHQHKQTYWIEKVAPSEQTDDFAKQSTLIRSSIINRTK